MRFCLIHERLSRPVSSPSVPWLSEDGNPPVPSGTGYRLPALRTLLLCARKGRVVALLPNVSELDVEARAHADVAPAEQPSSGFADQHAVNGPPMRSGTSPQRWTRQRSAVFWLWQWWMPRPAPSSATALAESRDLVARDCTSGQMLSIYGPSCLGEIGAGPCLAGLSLALIRPSVTVVTDYPSLVGSLPEL